MSRLGLVILLLTVALGGLSGCAGSGAHKPSPTAQPTTEAAQPTNETTPQALATPTPQPTTGEPLDKRILANIPLIPGGVNFRGPNGMAINPAADRLYISFKGTQNVAVLDTNTNEIVAAIDFGLEPEEPRWPGDVAIDSSHDRIYVAIDGLDPEVVVIDGESASVTNRISQPADPVSLAINPLTGRLYVALSGYRGQVISVFDTKSAVKIADIPLDDDPTDVAVNVATNRLYVTKNSGDNVSVIDGNSNQVVKAIGQITNASQVAADPDRNRIYVMKPPEGIFVLDGASDEVKSQIELGAYGGGGLVVHPDTGAVYTQNFIGSQLLVLEGEDAKAKEITKYCGGWEGSLAINPETSRLYAVSSACDVLKVVDIANNVGGDTESVPLGSKPADVVVGQNGRKLYVANSSGDVVSVVDTATRKVVRNVGVGREPTRLAIDQDANDIYALTTSGLYVIDGDTDSVASVVEVGGEPHDLALDPKAGRAYVTELKPGDGGIRVIDTKTRTLVQRLADPFAHFALFCEDIAANTTTGKIYVAHLTGGKVSPVISSIEPVPSGLRETVTGWTQEGGPLTGGLTAFDATTLQTSAALVLPVYPYGVPIAADESTNKIYAALNVGALSGAGIDAQIGLTVIDGTTDAVTQVLVPSEEVRSYFTTITDMATDRTGSRIFMTAQNDALIIINARELAVEAVINLPHGSIPEGLAIDPESGKIYVANSGNGTISVIETS